MVLVFLISSAEEQRAQFKRVQIAPYSFTVLACEDFA